MKKVSLVALGLALALGSTTPALAKKEQPKANGANYSPDLIPLAKAAQDALTANDLDTALAKAQAAEPLIKTDDDKLIVGNFYVQIGQKKNDNALLGKGLDLMLSSGKVEAANQAKLYTAQGQLAFQAKDFRKAETAMGQAFKLGGGDMNDIVPILAESQRANGELTQAIQTISDAVDKAAAAGQPVPNEWYARGFTIGYEAKSTNPQFAQIRTAAMALNKKWLAAQPTGSVWHDTMLLYQDANQNDKDLQLDIERLLFAAGGLKGTNEYLGYADDTYVRLPGEAKAVLASGIAKGVVNPASNRNVGEINTIVTGKVKADQASLPASDKSARAAANGRLALATADGYASYGDYAKAIDLYKVALQKGGVDANVVNTRLGVAQFKSGDKAGAKQTFGQLTGNRKDLGDFWSILIDHPATGAPA